MKAACRKPSIRLAAWWFVESLTDKLEQQVLEIFAQLERRGGMLASIEDGWVQRDPQQRVCIPAGGRSQAAALWSASTPSNRAGPRAPGSVRSGSLEAQQIKRLRTVRESRDGQRAQQALDALREAASGSSNLMPFILEAVRACATVGEIADTLRVVWGVYRPSLAL